MRQTTTEKTFGNGRETNVDALAHDLTIVEMVSGFGRRSFGLGYAVLNLAAAVHRAGANVYLASLDSEDDAREASAAVGFPQERIICGAAFGSRSFRVAPLLSHRLRSIPGREHAVIHLHGMWTHAAYVAGTLRRRWGCPLVLSPHGELAPYALGISPKLKAAASKLYARRNLMEAACVWALSTQEREAVREHGFQGRVAVIPSGVYRGQRCSAEELQEFRRRHGVPDKSPILLFLSRVARIKNLPLLIEAFARNVRLRPEWTLLIAGPGERGHLEEVRSLIRSLGIEASARLIGRVTGREKACAFASASIFALPSHTEGLPIAALEAMEYEKPLLLTDGWEFPLESDEKFAWRVPAEDDAFTAALLAAMNASAEQRAEMGRAGRKLVREHFDWDFIGRRACSLYRSLL